MEACSGEFNIIQLEEIDSTNQYALRNISTLNDRDIVVAEIQTAGKGRLNRKWVSSYSGNLYFSIILKPSGEVSSLPLVNITQLMALCVTKTLEQFNISPIIKWPNDVLINDKKICGILSEISFTGDKFDGFVIGTGINLNNSPSSKEVIDKPVTSLYNEMGNKVDRISFLYKLLDEFFKSYNDFPGKGFQSIKDQYLTYFPYIGKTVTIKNGIEDVEGIITDIADDGSLHIRKSDGSDKNIILGDMTCSIQV